MIPLRVKEDQAVIAVKGYSTFPRAIELETDHQMVLMSYARQLVCVWGEVLPLRRDSVGVFYSFEPIGLDTSLSHPIRIELTKVVVAIVCSIMLLTNISVQ